MTKEKSHQVKKAIKIAYIDKGVKSKINKECLEANKSKRNSTIKKWERNVELTFFQKKYINVQQEN